MSEFPVRKEPVGQPHEPPVHVLEVIGNAIVGGMEKYVQNLAYGLPSRNIKVSCLAPYESAVTEQLRAGGVCVYITAMSDDPHVRSLQFLCELIRHEQIDVLHAHLNKAHILAGLAGRLTHIPVAATIHGMEINVTELGIARMVGSHIVVVCQQAYAQVLSLGVPPQRVTLIPNGVNLHEFKPSHPKIDFRSQFCIPPEAPLVGYVGRFNWEKGPDLFLRMAGDVVKRRPDVHFIMVGDGPMRDELTELVDELGLSANLHFAGLLMETQRVYPAFDLLVQTSNIEGMPFALLEGMASGLPSAVINVGGVGELVIAGVTGTLSAEGDWGGVAEAVVHLLDNPEAMKKMGAAARKRVETLFNLSDRLDQFAALFRSMVQQNREPVTGIWNPPVMDSEVWSPDCARVKVEKPRER